MRMNRIGRFFVRRLKRTLFVEMSNLECEIRDMIDAGDGDPDLPAMLYLLRDEEKTAWLHTGPDAADRQRVIERLLAGLIMRLSPGIFLDDGDPLYGKSTG